MQRTKRPGPLRVAEPAPSKGERRPGHKGHRPLATFSGQGQSSARKVVRMYENLQARGWTFRFRTEAVSPSGFKYAAEGDSPLEAFLRAFGQWQGDLADIVPKIPEILRALKPSPIVPPPAAPLPHEPAKRVYKKTRIKELLQMVPEVAALRRPWPRLPPSPDPLVNRERIYRRMYMRQYRSGQRRKRSSVPMAAVA